MRGKVGNLIQSI